MCCNMFVLSSLCSFYILKHVRLLDFLFWNFALFSLLLCSWLGFLGWTRVHIIQHTRRPNYAYTGSFKFLFCFLYLSHMLSFYLFLFLYVYKFESLFHMFACLIAFHMFKLGFVFISLLNAMSFIHMFMHNAIGSELLQGKWGKSCIHMNMHIWIWFCLTIDLNMIAWWVMLDHMLAWIFSCLCLCLVLLLP